MVQKISITFHPVIHKNTYCTFLTQAEKRTDWTKSFSFHFLSRVILVKKIVGGGRLRTTLTVCLSCGTAFFTPEF